MRAVLACVVVLAAAAVATAAAPDSQVIIGNVRVQALSPTLIRVEPKGPLGFHDNTTFVVVNRNFPGVSLTQSSGNATHAVLTSKYYTITVNQKSPTPPGPVGCNGLQNTDITDGQRISTCQDMSKPCTQGGSQTDCCNNCTSNSECKVWIYSPSYKDCWLMASADGTKSASDRVTGGYIEPSTDGVSVTVTSPSGTVLFQADDLGSSVNQNLNWPSPTTAPSYAFKDYPRFYAPPWGPTPPPASAHIDPALKDTNGYDYRNNVDGDTYIFLLGSSLDSWFSSRREFIQLAGPTPQLPDFAFGTWFTYWHQYTEDEAKGEVERWQNDSLPIDVWALDMNWRNSPHGHQPGYKDGMNHYYTYPNTQLFPDFADPGTAWFDWLKSKGIRTYFNDHPFPANNGSALQTSPEEVAFRFAGLSLWMSRGLTYWWFDANWGFSIPPPNVHYGGSGDGSPWDGMTNRVWGSHVYYESIRRFGELNPNRQHTLPLDRPMALTKYADDNMVPGLVQHQHPAHHRYPVWWTGDGVSLQASVESMVDSGVYDFKPYVHSDCGGDYRPKQGGDLLRWASHCSFGSILRFHGDEHQPWSYNTPGFTDVEDTIRSYLQVRYKMIPSLISAGQQATQSAFPFVTRCDLFWPEHAPSSSSNHQYLYLNDTLVAPIWDSSNNVTSRSVWIPPGQWQDAWSGQTVTGPQDVTSSQPYERIPLWHRRGGLVVMTSEPGLRVDEQDWSELTLEAFPSQTPETTTRFLYERKSQQGARTTITMETDHTGAAMRLRISPDDSSDTVARKWVLRVHLLPGQTPTSVALNGIAISDFRHIQPLDASQARAFFPFGGKFSAPAPAAGAVVEIDIPALHADQHVLVTY